MEEVFIPASGMAMEEVLLSEWLKQPGDRVEAGDVLAVVETDKSTVELSGQSSGRLSRHLVAAGERARGGTTVAYVLAEGEVEPGAAGTAPTLAGSAVAGAAVAGAAVAGAAVAGSMPPVGAGNDWNGNAAAVTAAARDSEGRAAGDKAADGRHLFSPRQRREAILAAATGAPPARPAHAEAIAPVPAPTSALTSPAVDEPRPAARVSPDMSRTDASSTAAQSAPAASVSRGVTETAAASNRRATAELVSESWRMMPHFSVGREVRAEGLLATLAQARAEGIDATATDLMLRAFAAGLEQVGERPDVGLAVATEWGVLIPVLRGVTGRTLSELASARRAAVDRARLRRLGSADADAPFATLSNLGPAGVRWFTGVVPLGQAALLTVGRIGPRPAVEGRGLVVAQMFDAVLTADHRRYDGVDSARLLSGFAEHLDELGGEEER